MATMMLLIGVGVFCGTMYRGSSLAVIMFDHVFHLKLLWIEAIQMIFVIIAASMAALGFMILFVGFLATGATRHKVYRAWGSRVGGRISCAVFMVFTYILKIVWIVILCFLSIVTFVFTLFWKMCLKTEVQTHRTCIDLTQFSGLRQISAFDLWLTLKFHLFRLPLPSGSARGGHESVRGVRSESFLQRRCGESWSYVHPGNAFVSAHHSQLSALPDVSGCELRAHSRPRKVPGASGDPKLDRNGVQRCIERSLLV